MKYGQIKIIPALLAIMFLVSCKKDEFKTVKVTYYVKIANGNSADITYYSDYYFDSGILKPVHYTNNGGVWSATRIVNKEEEYLIKVSYADSANAETDFRVKVIFNDTLTVDSAYFDFAAPLVELKGTVKN